MSAAQPVTRIVALACATALALTACGRDPEPEAAADVEGATVGVLLTEDLPGDDWGAPTWYYEDAVRALDRGSWPRFRCRLPDYAQMGPLREGMVAQASAAWAQPGLSEPMVWSVASRYENASATGELQKKLDSAVAECLSAVERGETEASLGGTSAEPVIDERYHDDVSSTTWRVRTAWTVLRDDVYVHVMAAWVDGNEAPVDVEELLDVAIERAETLPQTSPRPGFPPACEDC